LAHFKVAELISMNCASIFFNFYFDGKAFIAYNLVNPTSESNQIAHKFLKSLIVQ